MNSQLIKTWGRVLGLGCALMAADQAVALTEYLTAEFVPSLDNPSNNVFTNTSQAGQICREMPAVCDDQKSFSFSGRTSNQTPVIANHPDPRQGWFIKLPAEWRDITVRHTKTGETNQVQLRFIGFGGSLRIAPNATFATGVPDITAAHSALWNGGGLDVPPAPCTSKYHRIQDDIQVQFLWQMPVVAQCAKQLAFNLNSMQIYFLEVMYEIRTPTPLNMSAGTWEADYSYSLGPGQDFDFGDNVLPADPRLDLKISLSVAHHLRVVFPPGGDHLALEPEGGWVPWLTRGRQPERILRDQPFQFTSSGPVKMRLDCQYLVRGNCAISNARRHTVPVETRISLPAGMRQLTGGPISKALLTSADDLTAVADAYVADAIGNLHFEVGKTDVDAMLAYPDTTYSGLVTVMWDSILIP